MKHGQFQKRMKINWRFKNKNFFDTYSDLRNITIHEITELKRIMM